MKKYNHKTVFDSSLFFWISSLLARVFCFLSRWKVIGEKPSSKKYVVLMGTHGSNWDFIFMMATVLIYRQPIFWVGKKSLFSSRLGFFFRWCGGVSVGDLKSNGSVDQCVQYFKDRESCVIALAPKGTRKSGAEWKTGFYYIAKEACVPIALAFIDYKKRASGILKTYLLTGDMLLDMEKIKLVYADYESA